jgi:hypothetical protein
MVDPRDFMLHPYYAEEDPRTIGGRTYVLVGLFSYHDDALEWAVKVRDRSTIQVYARTLLLRDEHRRKHGTRFQWGVWTYIPDGWQEGYGEFPRNIRPVTP